MNEKVCLVPIPDLNESHWTGDPWKSGLFKPMISGHSISLLTDAKLVIRGKRSKQRIAYLGDGALAALIAWLELRGKDAGPIFVPLKRGGDLRHGRRLSPQSIYYLLKVRAKRADVKPFTPHDLRRTFVSRLLGAGVDIAIVAKMAGHSNIQTTAPYDRRPEETKQRAAQLLKIPYAENLSKLRELKESWPLYVASYC